MVCRSVAVFLGTAIDVIVAGPADAMVDLSVACMFEHEREGAGISGGLLHLNQALGGALESLRTGGAFRAREMESMLFTNIPAGMRPNALLVIGLGDPDTFSPSILERAIAVAVREAIRMKVKSTAFSPDLLDAGMGNEQSGVRETAMVKGLTEALRGEHHLFHLGFTNSVSLRTWSFGSGPDHLDVAAGAFAKALRDVDQELGLEQTFGRPQKTSNPR
jgi:hypothetical protein